MFKRILIIALLSCCSMYVVSQRILSLTEVDRQTYLLYQQGAWKELIDLGKGALNQGLDFYYLRLRMGIAFYEQKRYRQAITHFLTLYKLYPQDELVKEYLYFSNLLGGNIEDARRLSGELTQHVRERFNIKSTSIIEGLYGEYKEEIPENYSSESAGRDTLYQMIRDKLCYFSIGAIHGLGPRMVIFHSFGQVKLNNTVFDSGDKFSEEVQQDQYYIKINLCLGWNKTLIAAIHVAETKVEGFTRSDFVNTDMTQNRELTYRVVNKSFVGYLGFCQDISLWRIKLGVAYLYIDNRDRWQSDASLVFYPLGNSNFYLTCKYTHLLEEEGTEFNQLSIWTGKVSVRLGKNTWLQPAVHFGDMYYHVENYGYTLFNGLNSVRNRTDIMLTQYLLKSKIALVLLWQTQRERSLYRINSGEYSKDIIVNSLTGGIKWNF